MKKILKGLGFAVLALVVAAVAAVFIMTHDWSRPAVQSAQTSPTFIDSSGIAHNIVVDSNGVTFAVVADEAQNVWQVEINPDGSLGETVASLNEYFSASDVLTTQAGEQIIESVDPNDYVGKAKKVSTTAAQPEETAETIPSDAFANHPESTTQPAEGAEAESTKKASSASEPASETQPAPKELNFEKYRKMLADGTYYMEFTTSDESLGDAPIISAKKGNNILVTTTIEGMTGTVIYRGDNDKTYFVIDDWKQYFSLPKKFLGEDIDMSEMDLLTGFFSEKINTEKFKSEAVEINGKTLTRESYVTKSGTTRNYYFDDGKLVRIDTVDKEGEENAFYISSVTNVVPDSTFDIPADYKYLNLSWLL